MTDRKRIYLCLAHMSEDGAEQRYVKEAFDTNWVVPLGPNVNAFEKDLEEFVNHVGFNHEPFTVNHEPLTKRVVALSAGTAAVHLALIACGVQPGARPDRLRRAAWRRGHRPVLHLLRLLAPHHLPRRKTDIRRF